MSLTPDEQALLDFALGSLPDWFSDAQSRDLAVEAGLAKQAGAAQAQTAYWFRQAYITTADGPTGSLPDWLQLHAMDRGTRRAAGEADDELKTRLRQYPDAVTRDALIGIAQSIVDAAGVVGTVALLEPRKDRLFMVQNTTMSGTGGTFTAGPGDEARFAPVGGWPAPPYKGPNIQPATGYMITIDNAAAVGNEGSFYIDHLVANAAAFDNPGLVIGSDPAVDWVVNRTDQSGNVMTTATGRADGYLSRGYRIGSMVNSITIILPYGTTAATQRSVAEAIRQRKAAGFRVVIERRLNP